MPHAPRARSRAPHDRCCRAGRSWRHPMGGLRVELPTTILQEVALGVQELPALIPGGGVADARRAVAKLLPQHAGVALPVRLRRAEVRLQLIEERVLGVAARARSR